MANSYTSNLLIKYIYSETDIADRLELEYAIETSAEVRSQYLDLRNSYKNLPKVQFAPKKTTMDSILAYSKASA